MTMQEALTLSQVGSAVYRMNSVDTKYVGAPDIRMRTSTYQQVQKHLIRLCVCQLFLIRIVLVVLLICSCFRSGKSVDDNFGVAPTPISATPKHMALGKKGRKRVMAEQTSKEGNEGATETKDLTLVQEALLRVARLT